MLLTQRLLCQQHQRFFMDRVQHSDIIERLTEIKQRVALDSCLILTSSSLHMLSVRIIPPMHHNLQDSHLWLGTQASTCTTQHHSVTGDYFHSGHDQCTQLFFMLNVRSVQECQTLSSHLCYCIEACFDPQTPQLSRCEAYSNAETVWLGGAAGAHASGLGLPAHGGSQWQCGPAGAAGAHLQHRLC